MRLPRPHPPPPFSSSRILATPACCPSSVRLFPQLLFCKLPFVVHSRSGLDANRETGQSLSDSSVPFYTKNVTYQRDSVTCPTDQICAWPHTGKSHLASPCYPAPRHQCRPMADRVCFLNGPVTHPNTGSQWPFYANISQRQSGQASILHCMSICTYGRWLLGPTKLGQLAVSRSALSVS